jgi:hypothetical protein
MGLTNPRFVKNAISNSTVTDGDRPGGRPDTMKLIKEVYDAWEAEVVFITSNWQGNKEMMEGCKQAGIPAFVSNLEVSFWCFTDICGLVLVGDTMGLLSHLLIYTHSVIYEASGNFRRGRQPSKASQPNVHTLFRVASQAVTEFLSLNTCSR